MTKDINKISRMAVYDAQGRRQHLASGEGAFAPLRPTGRGVLLLGLGGDVAACVRQFSAMAGDAAVYWLEAPAMSAQRDALDPAWRSRLPGNFVEIALDGQNAAARRHTLAQAAQGRQIWQFAQNMRLFPNFWGEVWGVLQAEMLHLPPAAPLSGGERPWVLLPGDTGSLLHREVAQGFAAAGCDVRGLDTANPAVAREPWRAVAALLREGRPRCCVAINGRGLDAQGLAHALLAACGVPVVLWFVDNPWHILSALRQDWWKRCLVCVTDASFIPPLHTAGAAQVRHLPLAAAQHMFAPLPGDAPAQAAPLLFVGRASFPAHDRFFAAARVDADVEREALALLDADGPPPDFAWWVERLGVALWPGAEVRCAGLGAERCARAQRARWLAVAAGLGVQVYGDATWRELVPQLAPEQLHPPVDYYGSLPRLYASAACTLNVTSLLLPWGLTQRHFDVWAAGGLLLTNATRGLDIFPAELVREIHVPAPAALPDYLRRLDNDARLRHELRTAWAACIRRAHTYTHRAQTILDWLPD